MRSLLLENTSIGMMTRWLRHLLAGGTGTLLYIGLVAFWVEAASLHPVASVVLAFLILELYTYVINRVWVYQAARGHLYAVPRFLTVTAIALALNSGIMFISVELCHWWYLWGLALTAVIVPPTNFLLNYYWAFK